MTEILLRLVLSTIKQPNHLMLPNCIGGVMVSVLALSAVVILSPDRVKQKAIILAFVASPLSMQH